MWRCACGAINRQDEPVCHRCQKEAAVLSAMDLDKLKADRDERLALAQKKAEEEREAERKRLELERQKAEEAAAEAERKRIEKQEKIQAAVKKYRKIAAICGAAAAAVVVVALVVTKVVLPMNHYNDAVALMEDGKQQEAIAMFEKAHGYQDSEQYIRTLLADTVSAGVHYTVGLKADGTVVAVGYNEYGQCDVSDWRDIVAVFAGHWHTVGLKADGSVVAVGYNGYCQCNVSTWKNIRLPYSPQ